MSTTEYRNFKNIEEFQKYYKLNYYAIKRIKTTHYWKKHILGNYFIGRNNTTNVVERSIIHCFGSSYLYFSNDSVHSLVVSNIIDYRPFENKLYHLTHGPKALSIPDAFKVLSL